MASYVIYSILLCFFTATVTNTVTASAQVAQYIANHFKVEYRVVDNLDKGIDDQFHGEISLENNGQSFVGDLTWEIYLCSVRVMEYQVLGNFSLSQDGSELGDTGIKVYHVDGCLHKLKPTGNFSGIAPGHTLVLPFLATAWTIQRTDVMPRWFVTSPSEDAYIITSTAGESLDFVADFTTENQWKRSSDDQYNPFTAQQRFESNSVMDTDMDDIIPTPKQASLEDTTINIMTGDWRVKYTNMTLQTDAQYLADKLGMEVLSLSDSTPVSRYILLDIDEVSMSEEGYHMNMESNNNTIEISGGGTAGVFYGIQTLLSLSASSHMSGMVRAGSVTDHPRFSYRGMHLDTARNFFGKQDVLQLLDAMAMYKLNKFHFHLTDDEGWRLEIPGVNEATQIGGRQCFDLNQTECILPQLGSGSRSTTSGSGFYTVQEYKEILQYAQDRHIEVIPEFDMPGHSHAIIKAMEARAMNGNDSFLLSDPNDTSEYLSVQYFKYNALNPCRNSTYDFVRYLIQEIKEIHSDIQPLKIFNFGGDEVAVGAWERSPLCQQLIQNNTDFDLHNETTLRTELQKYFAIRLADMAAEEDLDFAGWEDGLGDHEEPFDRSSLNNDNVYMYAWNNIWEWHGGERAYVFANNDYKVIIGHATHLYFDHPQEPDPEERGFYWATRYTDTRKSFEFDAEDVYNNIDTDLNGMKIDKAEFCTPENRCVPLMENKTDNIIGLQGHLWSETVRTSDQLHSMVFPRLLALAERAWHRADWEGPMPAEGADRDMDWAKFAGTLGRKELRRLDDMGIQYYIPVPGAKLSVDGSLQANSMFPGLTIQYSTDSGDSWTDYKDGAQISAGNDMVHLRTRSAGGGRYSRMTSLDGSIVRGVEISTANLTQYNTHVIIYLLCLALSATALL